MAIAEPSQILATSSLPSAEPVKTQGKRLFSGEFAREMAKKSVEVRRQREIEAKQAKAIVGQLQADAIVEPEHSYRLFRLARTREQLLALDKQLEACTDPKLLKSLADAIARLCDVEQKLALRPLPGSRRPGRETPSKRTGEVGPVE